MTKEQQLNHFESLVDELRQILIKKGDDYAGIDRLSNFKLAGEITRIGAPVQVLSLIATKVARLGQLFESLQSPNNESVRDSVLDLINYGILLDMVLVDTTPGVSELEARRQYFIEQIPHTSQQFKP